MSRAAARLATRGFGLSDVQPASFFFDARAEFVDRLPHDPTARVLEVGCGNGATGALALSEGYCGHYAGIEGSETDAAIAREVLSEVIGGDVEALEFDWPPAAFDALLLADVLINLRDPKRTLRKLARFVRPGGLLIASVPNVAHWRVIRALLAGRFDMQSAGISGAGELRWLVPAALFEMAEDAGFVVDEIGPLTPFSGRRELVSRLTDGRFDHLFMRELAVVARKR